MVGRSAAICGALAAPGCAHEASQDATTGADGWPSGASRIALNDNAGSDAGSVSYPAGDRVDWKRVELPRHQVGTLDLTLTWQGAHQRERLGFDVFDGYGDEVLARDPAASASLEPVQAGRVDHARGTYFVRVYAVDRRDAGTYQLAVAFAPTGPGFDATALAVPAPPALPEVPADETCPSPADVRIAACQATMPCPSPPDRRVQACEASAWPACDLAHRDRGNPNCDHASYPRVVARIVKTDLRAGVADVFVTIAAGKRQGVSTRWSARVLSGDGEAPLSGGAVTLVRVDDAVAIGRVKLTTDQVAHGSRVELLPPASDP